MEIILIVLAIIAIIIFLASDFFNVKEIIVETVNCDADAVVLDAKLSDDLGIDSLDAMEINMALEEAFAISIADEDLVKFVCVKDIVSYIESKVEA